ncbi:MAG: ATP-NAD kinase family protein [Thaumarchaeota archaeon]|nr:ATP-NAD kinase family protein [Nitrososphaerota archaeon]
MPKKVGLIVNPVAGMGGRVGLKGTDGTTVAARARKLGASPESPRRAVDALRVLARIKDEIEILAAPGAMGQEEVVSAGMKGTIIGSAPKGRTGPEDTVAAARAMKRAGIDLLLFVGGDGTAGDIHRAVGRTLVVLGIPAGVKMHSAVFGRTPRAAAEAAIEYLHSPRPQSTNGEVMDIDEGSFGTGVVSARLYGTLRIPKETSLIQVGKSGSSHMAKGAAAGIAKELASIVEPKTLYILGPGTTTRDVLSELGIRKTLLGVDVMLDGKLVAKDVTERKLASLIRRRSAKIVATVIGGQGYLFGRGNQQISAEIISKVGKENIIVLATKEKLASLEGRPLLVDTGDEATDKLLTGHIRVITGLNDYVVYRLSD